MATLPKPRPREIVAHINGQGAAARTGLANWTFTDLGVYQGGTLVAQLTKDGYLLFGGRDHKAWIQTACWAVKLGSQERR